MKPIFIALLHQIVIAEDLGSGDKINETLRITNNRDVIARLVPQPFRSYVEKGTDLFSEYPGFLQRRA